jgi:hypothetical protein
MKHIGLQSRIHYLRRCKLRDVRRRNLFRRDFFDDLTSWDCSLAINPFSLNSMVIFGLHHLFNRSQHSICNKTESSGFPSPFVFKYGTVLDISISAEVLTKFIIREIMRKAPHKYFSVLRIIRNYNRRSVASWSIYLTIVRTRC